MAKTIKFNLICDGNPSRTIEDLQNHFSIEDVLAYYNNQLLHRWLKVRGYNKELEAVSALSCTEPVEIIKELIRVFEVAADPEKVEESVYILKYLNERKALCDIYNTENYQTKHVIDDYEAGYQQLKDAILREPDNVALIKANIAEIVNNYSWVLQLDHRSLFYELCDKSVLAIMCLLMNEGSRHYYLPVQITGKDGEPIPDTEVDADKNDMYTLICQMITTSSFAKSLGDNLHVFAGMTDGYWKDLEPKGKRYMIISMGSGDYVRSAGQAGGDLSYTNITKKFVIVNGIDYKSNSDTRKLQYIEV